jgi:hypothetical protein
MRIELHGVNLPGRRCGPNPAGGWYEKIHVGLGRPPHLAAVAPGDAPAVHFACDVTVRTGRDGGLRLGGPFIHGKPGSYCLYLSWGTVADDGAFTLFRATKLNVADIDPAVLAAALQPGGTLVGHLVLTDAKGHPGLASVRPPHLSWQVLPGS